MRRAGLLLLLLVLLATTVAPAAARVEPDTPEAAVPSAAYAIADEQFVGGTLRDQMAVARFLEVQESPLAGTELEPVLGRPMAAPAALTFLGEAYSVSPSLLLTLAEMEVGALSGDSLPAGFPVQVRRLTRTLSRWFYDYYYGVGAARDGGPKALNAGNGGTYALRNYFFTQIYGSSAYPAGERNVQLAAWERALAATYARYFGSLAAGRLVARQPTVAEQATLPALKLPWLGGDSWYFTGGPHNFDGSKRLPLAGIDFQPTGTNGCRPPVVRQQPVVAAAGGRTVGYQSWWVSVDHDYDGDVMSGWQTVYGHLADRVAGGMVVAQGQRLGDPSCYGGFASGVHVHFGVKFENVWQPISAFALSGWRIERGEEAYEGRMVGAHGEERPACYDAESSVFDCSRGSVISDNTGADVAVWKLGYE